MCENKKPLARAGVGRSSEQEATFKGDDLSPQNKSTSLARQDESHHNNSTLNQELCMLASLKTGKPRTTLEFRNEMGIMHPAARVKSLRAKGYNVETLWANEIDAAGKVHRVASYLLRRNR